MKIDPYKHKERYLSWKASINGRIPNLSKENSKIVFEYILDMENGLNEQMKEMFVLVKGMMEKVKT